MRTTTVFNLPVLLLALAAWAAAAPHPAYDNSHPGVASDEGPSHLPFLSSPVARMFIVSKFPLFFFFLENAGVVKRHAALPRSG